MAPLHRPRPASASIPLVIALLCAPGCATARPPTALPADARIATELAARLAAATELYGYDLTMEVEGSVVRLTGTVGDERARQHAEELARRIEGVREVVNALEVTPLDAAPGLDDLGITARVRAKLAADPELHPSRLAVHTEAGTVTLTGRVATVEERQRAEQAARQTSGVREVRNLLEVGGPVDG